MTDVDDKILFIAGQYNQEFNDILGLNLQYKEIFQSFGLEKHIIKTHSNCKEYFEQIPEIIKNPDYIGVNPNENETSIELVKKYDKNILIGIKLDKKNDYLYVASLYDVKQIKIDNRLYSGRLKKFHKNG